MHKQIKRETGSIMRNVIAGLVAFIVLTGLFVLLFTYFVPKDTKDQQEQTEVSNETAQTGSDEIETTEVPEGYRVYVADELNFSFAYPREWGNVSRNQTSRTSTNNDRQVQFRSVVYTVGPLYMVATSSGSDKIGGNEDPAVIYSKGYIKEGEDYFARFAHQETSGTASPLNKESFDYFKQLKVDDETILVFGKDCGDAPDCILGSVINLRNDSQYPGIGIRYDRTFGQREGQQQDFDNAIAQFESVLKTFLVIR